MGQIPSVPVASHVQKKKKEPTIGPEKSLINKLMVNRPSEQTTYEGEREAKERIHELAPVSESVTTYGVGPSGILARELATERAMRQLGQYVMSTPGMPLEQAKQMARLAIKYPRVLAHTEMSGVPTEIARHGNFAGITVPHPNEIPGRSLVGLSEAPEHLGLAAKALREELTHAAQHIGLKGEYQKTIKAAKGAFRKMGKTDQDILTEIPHEQSPRWSYGRTLDEPGTYPDPQQLQLPNLPNPRRFWERMKDLGYEVPGRNAPQPQMRLPFDDY